MTLLTDIDLISKIRSLQTELNNEILDIPKMRRKVNNSNMRWLQRNVLINNPIQGKIIVDKIRDIIRGS